MKNCMASVLQGAEIYGRVPLWELEFHPWHKFTKQPFKVGVEFQQLSPKEKEMQININAEVMTEVTEKLHFSAVTVPGGYWETSPGEPAFFWLPPEYRFRQLEIIRKMLPADVLTVAITGGVMAIPEAANYVEFSCKLFDTPEEIDAMARKIFNDGIALMKVAKDAGADAVVTASDIADNRGPFFNSEQMKRFIIPYLQEWAEAVHREGLLSILHTDGNINTLLDQLCETGVQAVQAVDPVAGMNMAEALLKCRGRMALCGNINCGNLVAGTPESVCIETKKILLS